MHSSKQPRRSTSVLNLAARRRTVRLARAEAMRRHPAGHAAARAVA